MRCGAFVLRNLVLAFTGTAYMAAVGRSDRSADRPIGSIGSVGSVIFRPFENFSKDRVCRDDRFRPKIIKIRAILAIFRPFENFCEFRFDRFDIPFDSIDIASEGHGGPPWCLHEHRRFKMGACRPTAVTTSSREGHSMVACTSTIAAVCKKN